MWENSLPQTGTRETRLEHTDQIKGNVLPSCIPCIARMPSHIPPGVTAKKVPFTGGFFYAISRLTATPASAYTPAAINKVT